MTFKSRLKITDPNGLVKQPHDPYWDGGVTRREVQLAVNDLCANEAELMARVDTGHIVMNFLCARLGVKREEIEAFVAQKKQEMATIRLENEAQAKQQAGQQTQQTEQAQETQNGPNERVSAIQMP